MKKINLNPFGLLLFFLIGTGLAQEGPINRFAPTMLALDLQGNLIVGYGLQIRKMDANGTFTRIAGTGARTGAGCSFSGDGGPAMLSTVCMVTGLAIDSVGNIYFSDFFHYRIRKIDSAGNIFTVAGSGMGGFDGDGGPATQAKIIPMGIAIDKHGILFIADGANNRVRQVNSSGIISTVVGSGPTGGNQIGPLGDGGPANEARLEVPTGVAVDSNGDLIIADFGHNRVRKVTISTGTISTIAGTGEPYQPSSANNGDGKSALKASVMPSDIALGADGSIFIVDRVTSRIRKVDRFGNIFTVAGSPRGRNTPSISGDDGPAIAAILNGPMSVIVDGSGNIYIADTNNLRVRKVTPLGIISSVAGSEAERD